MGLFLAAYIAHSIRVLLAAGVMLLVAVAVWLVVGIATATLGIQTPTVIVGSMFLIATLAVATGSYVSVRYITPNSLLHPVLAAIGLVAADTAVFTIGVVGSLPYVLMLGAASVSALTAFVARSRNKLPS